jgi:uncharacterized membrane protein
MNELAPPPRISLSSRFTGFIFARFIAGLVIVAPIYLAVLLLLKAASSLMGLMEPVSKLLPEWLPGAKNLSVLSVLVLCFIVGSAVSTSIGQALWERIENALFQKIPGYALIRSLMQQLAGRAQDQTWKPAMAEIEDALVPAFIIEELADDRYTIFVPSAPTPLAGAIYVLARSRVHPLNVPFTEALKAVSRWGSGSRDLIASMQKSEQLT